jgi:hypothetical protein
MWMPHPFRTRRRTFWVLTACAVATALALLIPGSPVHLPNLLVPKGTHEGRPVRHWVRDLDSPDPEVRFPAIFALGAIGADAAEAVPALADILCHDPDPDVRNQAALALSKMAPASATAVPALAQALADAELAVRMNATVALLRLGPEARPAVPALIRALKDENNQTNLGTFHATIQDLTAVALGRASAGTADGVPALAAALEEDHTAETRAAIVRGLGQVGPRARLAVPALVRAVEDEPWLREVVEDALASIGAPPLPAASLRGKGDRRELPEAERAYLWQIEHHGNQLVRYGFRPLGEALKRADAAALTRMLAADFAGTDLHEPTRQRAKMGDAEVERLQDAGRPPGRLDREAFVRRLLGFRGVFAGTPPQVQLALKTLSPCRRGQLDGEWEGAAQLRLHGESTPGAPAEVVVALRYRIPRLTKEALTAPGWLGAAAVEQVATATAPRYLFAEVARQRGLRVAHLHDNWKAERFVPTPGGVYVTDFDRDGILDVLVTDVTGCALYRGRPGGIFEDVTTRVGLPRAPPASSAVAWVDIDGDGWDDLILGGRIFRNERGTFVDYTRRCNLRLPADASNVIVADYDRDGRLDLYVTRTARPGSKSWLDGKSGDPRGNVLFRNKGGWQFEDVTRTSGAGGGRRSTFTAAWLDANNDGWPDLHVANEFGDGVLLVNNRNGTFSPHALADRPADFGTMGLAVGDIDNDGHIDLFCANMYSKAGTRVIGNLAADAYPPRVLEKMRRFVAGSQIHLNKGGLRFEQAGAKMQVAAVGWSYGACLADLDNDGWLDLYATAGFVSRSRTEPDG